MLSSCHGSRLEWDLSAEANPVPSHLRPPKAPCPVLPPFLWRDLSALFLGCSKNNAFQRPRHLCFGINCRGRGKRQPRASRFYHPLTFPFVLSSPFPLSPASSPKNAMDGHFVQNYVPGLGVVDPFARRTSSLSSMLHAIMATAIFRCWHILMFFGAWSTAVSVLTHNVYDLSISPTLLTVYVAW